MSERDARSRAAAMGRYGRNAMVQGAAAELFKRWAVTLRARLAGHGVGRRDRALPPRRAARAHARPPTATAVARLVADCLQEAAAGWAPDDAVRFVADVAVVPRWSDAK